MMIVVKGVLCLIGETLGADPRTLRLPLIGAQRLWKEKSKRLLYNSGVLAACIVCHCLSDVFNFLLDKCNLIHRKSEITAHKIVKCKDVQCTTA